LLVGQIGGLSALIAFGTILSNLLLGFALPPPLYEITVAPAFYLAIAVLYPRRISFLATVIGSGVGEAVNLFVFGQGAAFALTFIPGIIIARSPETLIVHRFRNKTVTFRFRGKVIAFHIRGRTITLSLDNEMVIAVSMIIATVYETLAFFLIDWPVYSYTIFYGCPANGPCLGAGLAGGFWLAFPDFFTIIDLVWIPVALVLVVAVRRAYNTRYFG